MKKLFIPSNLWTVNVHPARELVYVDVPRLYVVCASVCMQTLVCIDDWPLLRWGEDDFMAPHWCSPIHFSPCWWILMAGHGPVGVKGMFWPITDIDFIDKHWPERLAYFSWTHLETQLRGQADKTLTKHVTDSTKRAGLRCFLIHMCASAHSHARTCVHAKNVFVCLCVQLMI